MPRVAVTWPARIVIVGVGNVMMQDDGIGVWAVRALVAAGLPPSVHPVEGGVRGLDWLAPVEGAERLLIIDAVAAGRPPGTLIWLAPDRLPEPSGRRFSAHAFGLGEVLAFGRLLGRFPETRILGVQSGIADRPGPSLTAPLRRALPAITMAVWAQLRAWHVAAAAGTGPDA